MAENLGDGEFWLPSEFLVEDILMGNKNRGKENENSVSSSPEFQSGFGSFGSGFSSPAGSAETESDEEDYMVLDRLTRQMGRHRLQHRERNPSSFDGEKTKMVMAGSPQSTLCAVGSWAEHSQGSSRNSPTGPSQVSSPPSTSLNPKGDAWDLLNEAAGQIVRMKITGEAPKSQARGLLDPPKKAASTRYYMNQALTLQQLKTNKFQQLKQQQLMKQQSSGFRGKQSIASPSAQQMQQSRGRPVGGGGGGFVKGRCNQGFPPAAWPPLQQQPQLGSGMRAVFLGESGSRRESCGTGVFLPRRVGSPTELRKKPAACSTVLLPAKVVHALNLNLDEMGAAQPRFHPTFTHQYDRLASPYNICIPQQQQRSSHDQGRRPHPAPANQELRLPPEWTY